jgi:hypothetical protein
MKRQLLLFFFGLFCFSVAAQKSYTFNYIAEYEFRKIETSKPKKRWVLSNAADNTYYAIVSESDDGKYVVYFSDEKSGIRSWIYTSEKEFLKTETFKARCKNVRYRAPITRKQKENYSIFVKNDTLIDQAAYKQYGFSKLVKTSDLDRHYGDMTCVLEKDTEFHKPLFYSEYIGEMTTGEIPNGILKESFVRCITMNRNEYLYKLVNYKPTIKFLTIPDDCDFAPPAK